MRVSRKEASAIDAFNLRQRAQRQAASRLYARAAAEPEKVRAYLATKSASEIRNSPQMMRLTRIVGG